MNPANLLDLLWIPHPGQRDFLDAPHKTRVLACGRRWGKTLVCAADLLKRLLRAASDPAAPPERAMIVAPTIDQARLTFNQVVLWIDALVARGVWPEDLALPKIRLTPHPEIILGPHSVVARSAQVPRLLRGHGATHIVVDEAAFVDDETISEVLMPMLATTDGRLTLVSTPRGRNFFAAMFDAGLRDEAGPDESGKGEIWSRNAPSVDNPAVSGRFLVQKKALMPQRAYEVEYEAKFHDAAGSVFRTRDVEAAAALAPSPNPSRAVMIGVDWARTGDATAFAVVAGTRDAAVVLEVQRHWGESFTEQRERLAELLARYPGARVVADDTGLGKPVNELLNDLRSSFALQGQKVRGVTFNARSKGDMVAALQVALEGRHLAIPPDPELLRELQNFACWSNPSGSLAYGASTGHDDLVCALMLAVANLSTNSAFPLIVGRERLNSLT